MICLYDGRYCDFTLFWVIKERNSNITPVHRSATCGDMVKAYVGSILLALLAIGYVTSTAHELPSHDNPEQQIENTPDENGYDQLEAEEDTAPLSTADDDEVKEQQEQLQEDVLPEQEEVEEQQARSEFFATTHMFNQLSFMG